MAEGPVVIDGSAGEGGGQVVRVALALAAATRRAVRIVNVRAKRDAPGLKPQHVAAARAIAELSDGRVEGASVGSRELVFEPGETHGRSLEVRIGTAGSVALVLQTLLPACFTSGERFELVIHGGTDVPLAPTWDWLANVHLAALREMGVDIEATLVRRGYYPVGGGEVRVAVSGHVRPHEFIARPAGVALARVHAHGLPRHILERAREAAEDTLRGSIPVTFETEEHRGPGTGVGLAIWARDATLGADGVGERGLRAETLGARVAQAFLDEHGVSADPHHADMLPIALALAGGGSFTCRALSSHARTVLDVLPRFVAGEASVEPAPEGFRVRWAPTR